MLHRIVPTALAFVFAWHAYAPCAAGAESDQLAEAREMANKAADDLEEQRFDAALKKAQRAEQLYHAPPHILMMAEAYEGLGQLVDALEAYERLAAEPLSPSAPAAFRKARELGAKKEKALLSRVPSILIDVVGAPAEDAKAKVDGQPIPLGNGVATRLDPGKHTLRVEAPGFAPRDLVIELPERGGVVKVPVQLDVANVRRTSETNTTVDSDTKTSRTLLAPALITLSFGAAGIAAGAITGWLSLENAKELEEKCATSDNGGYRCPTSFQPMINETRQLSHISTGTFIFGGVAIATGITLLAVGKSEPSKSAFHIEPLVGPGSFMIRGRF